MGKKLGKITSMAKLVKKHKDLSPYGPRYSNASALASLDYLGEANDDEAGDQEASPGPGSYLDIYKNSSFKPKTQDDRLQDLLK